MIPSTEDIHAETDEASPLQPALDLAADVAARYEISALTGRLASARASVGQDEITVAVLGRFKAGKSSFLDHFIGRSILPVGVVPVTAVITEIRYGAREEARVHHRDGRAAEVALDQICGYISEKENPENTKQADLITVELPELRQFRGLKFVDTPGLDSALSHNTQTSLNWLPNVGLALVAVGVGPPLSQSDIDLLKSLYQYTSKVAVLLTKADLVSEPELEEVAGFVRAQLARSFPETIQIYPYSTKPRFARFRQALETELVAGTLERFTEERESILARKMDTLLRECGDYLALSLKSAEMVQSERQAMKRQLIAEKETLDEVKSAVRLVVQHTTAGTRAVVGSRLETHQRELERLLLEAFECEFPKWTKSLATMLSSFEEWVADALREQLTVLSIRERRSFLAPLHKVRNQAFRALQQFRDRLSDGAMRAFGAPLRTTETEIDVVEPGAPDNRALWGVEKEAGRRLAELIGTVERLVESGSNERASQLRADLERLENTRKSLAAETAS